MLYTKIKEVAKSQKKSINQMEKDLELGQGSVCRWNDIKPSYDKVAKVANYLNVPMTELIE